MTLAKGGLLLVGALAAGCGPDTHVLDEGRNPRNARQTAPTLPAGAADAAAAAAGPAELRAFAVTLAADCVRVRAEASAPVTARVMFRSGAQADERPLGEGASLFDAAFRLTGFGAGAEAQAVVSIVGTEGTPRDSEAARFVVPAPVTLSLAITEVLPNPAGDELTQEYLELRNLGPAPVALDGLAVEDDAGQDPLPAVVLPAGAAALVVPAGFVAGGGGDVPPRAGTPLLRVPGRIGRDGMRQQGETVRLVGPDGAVISSYGGHVDTTRPAWSGRSIQRLPDPTACDYPAAWSMSPLDPTPGW